MTIYDELDEFLATESGSEYTTEAVVGLKAWKEYFGSFKKEYATHFAAAKKADKAGDKKKFDAEIKLCGDIIDKARDNITKIEENAILNVICPLMCSWLWIVIRLALAATDNHDDPNKKILGNGSKQITMRLLDMAESSLDKYAHGYSDRHATTKESVSDFESALLSLVTECGEITAEEYDAIKSFYEAAEAAKTDDAEEAPAEDESDDSEDAKDSDEKEDDDDGDDDKDDEKSAKLSKKAQEVMDAFNDLSEKDQDTVKDLMKEHADDCDADFISYFEAAIEVVKENSDTYYHESAIDTFDCPEFTSLT